MCETCNKILEEAREINLLNSHCHCQKTSERHIKDTSYNMHTKEKCWTDKFKDFKSGTCVLEKEYNPLRMKSFLVYAQNNEEVIYGLSEDNIMYIYNTIHHEWEHVDKKIDKEDDSKKIKEAYWEGINVMEKEYKDAWYKIRQEWNNVYPRTSDWLFKKIDKLLN